MRPSICHNLFVEVSLLIDFVNKSLWFHVPSRLLAALLLIELLSPLTSPSAALFKTSQAASQPSVSIFRRNNLSSVQHKNLILIHMSGCNTPVYTESGFISESTTSSGSCCDGWFLTYFHMTWLSLCA